MKRTVFTLRLLPFSFSSLSVTTDSGAKGMLKFALKVSQEACELVEDSVKVDMRLAVLKESVRIRTGLNPTTLSIDLKNCSEVVRAYIIMDGTPDADDPNLSALDVGGITGVGSEIKTPAGIQQSPKSATPTPTEFAINGDGVHQLNYIASYVSPRVDATIGRIDVMIDFTV